MALRLRRADFFSSFLRGNDGTMIAGDRSPATSSSTARRIAGFMPGFLIAALLAGCGTERLDAPLAAGSSSSAATSQDQDSLENPETTPAIPSGTTIYTGLAGWTVLRPGHGTAVPAVKVVPANAAWSDPKTTPFPTVWISDAVDGAVTARPAGVYKYYWKFTIPRTTIGNPLAAIGTLRLYADNCLLKVGLNGIFKTFVTNTGSAVCTQRPGDFGGSPLDIKLSSFVTEKDLKTTNVLEFDVYNGANPGVSGSPTGIAVAPTVTCAEFFGEDWSAKAGKYLPNAYHSKVFSGCDYLPTTSFNQGPPSPLIYELKSTWSGQASIDMAIKLVQPQSAVTLSAITKLENKAVTPAEIGNLLLHYGLTSSEIGYPAFGWYDLQTEITTKRSPVISLNAGQSLAAVGWAETSEGDLLVKVFDPQTGPDGKTETLMFDAWNQSGSAFVTGIAPN
jgi:hypothetical protein